MRERDQMLYWDGVSERAFHDEIEYERNIRPEERER